MIKNLKVFKKSFSIAGLIFVLTFTGGCAKKSTLEDTTQSEIYMTIYDDETHKLKFERISEEQLENIDDSIIALTEEDDGKLYVASYWALGYEAAMQQETKQDAKNANPTYGNNIDFLDGFEAGQETKYLEKAQEEQRQYVSIRPAEDFDPNIEVKYYPADELMVISYEGYNALVNNYDEETVVSGNYEDLFGQNMSSYIGQEYTTTSLSSFAKENIDSLSDAIYIASGNYDVIPTITAATWKQVNNNTMQYTK